MIIKLKNDVFLEIRGNRNTFSIPYLTENLTYLVPLFYEIMEFYLNDYKKHIVNKRIVLAPYDFYNFANASSKRSSHFLTQNEYFAYLVYNLLLLPETENDALNEQWILQDEMNSRFHNIGTGGYKNKKYLKQDRFGGFLEAVYDENGIIVLDHINDGTYNMYHNHPLHSIDILLWIMYGVLSYDLLSVNDRVTVLRSSLNAIYQFKSQ